MSGKRTSGLRKDQAARAPLARLTIPNPRDIYIRTRSFGVLDRARKRPVVWIAAPAGAGKTTLMASYLKARKIPTIWYQMDPSDSDPASFFYYLGQGVQVVAPKKPALPLLTREYRSALPTFAANYFRSLFERLRPGSAIVFDNYQDAASADSPLHDLFAQGFGQIPEGVNVVVISRGEPPPAYTRHRANKSLSLLNGEVMRLTERETAEIVKLHVREERFSAAMARELHQKTQGWAAGIVLLTEQMSAKHIEPAIRHPTATQPVFDYFANEIFRRIDPGTRDFLLKTAFLIRFSPAIARLLTAQSESEEILKDLARRNFFTLMHDNDTYEYHPLFRVFLLNEVAKTYSSEQLTALKRRTGELLAQHGDVPAAIALLQEAQDWSMALALVVAQAPLLAEQGRTQTLENWLNRFPACSADDPRVLYWKGVCRMSSSPGEARTYFERAFAALEQQDDASPLYLAWAGIIESIILESDDFIPVDPWLERYRTLAQGRKAPSPEVEAASVFAYVSGLVHAHLDHPDLPAYVERAEQLLRMEEDTNRRFARAVTLVAYYIWKGESVKAGEFLESFAAHIGSPEATPLSRLFWYFCKMIHVTVSGSSEESVRTTNDALTLADESGIHMLDFQFLAWATWSQLCANGDASAARQWLRRMVPLLGHSKIREASYRLRVSAVLIHEGNIALAIEESNRALKLCKDIGFFSETVAAHATLSELHAYRGEIDIALTHAAEIRAIALRTKSSFFSVVYSLVNASVLRLGGRHELALQALREGLTSPWIAETGVSPMPWWRREEAAALFAMALEANIEKDHVRAVIKKHGLLPPSGYSAEDWPGRARIYTFGHFSIFTKDGALDIGKRAQRKPLEMFKALIVRGGRDVPAENIMQLMWPDMEGDMAAKVFDVTLCRLRKLFGNDVIELHNGKLTLNSSYCWFDVWAFEQLLEPAAEIPLSVKMRRLLDVYRGPFLENDDTPLVNVQRERLRSKFLRTMSQVGQALEAQADTQSAIECYQRVVEIDPLAEECQRRLMGCYWHLNRFAEALAVYQRFRNMLTSTLQIEPAEETMAMYEEIRRSCTGAVGRADFRDAT